MASVLARREVNKYLTLFLLFFNLLLCLNIAFLPVLCDLLLLNALLLVRCSQFFQLGDIRSLPVLEFGQSRIVRQKGEIRGIEGLPLLCALLIL